MLSEGLFGNRVDEFGTIVHQDWEHYLVHQGEMFSCADVDNDIDNASPKYWMILTPATAKAHIAISAGLSDAGLFEIYKAPTTSGNGSQLTCQNMKDWSTNMAVVQVFKDPTVSNDGTLVFISRLGGAGLGNSQVSGSVRDHTERLINVSSKYIIKLTPDGDTKKGLLNMEYYEEEA